MKRDSQRRSGYKSKNQEGVHRDGTAIASNQGWYRSAERSLRLPMTTGSICGKLFPEPRKWPSPNSSFPTNAISVAARTSWLCRYSMSKAQGRIRAQLIGDRANHIQLKERHRRAARGMAVHFFCRASCSTSSSFGHGRFTEHSQNTPTPRNMRLAF
jgi:hypothetical protein